MLSKIFSELARRANNGELLNKHATRDSKDKLTAKLWAMSKKYSH